jgi:NADPH:quinone reductase-like Zn-dependent oxidoreductase
MRAVRFERYGGVDVLEVRDVEDPSTGPGEVRVAVKATGLNPGEIAIREGRMHARWPATFPSGQGSDFAGIVDSIGDGVSDFAVGDEVLGWTDQRAAQAELVVAPTNQVTIKPAGVSWEVAGSLHVAAFAADSSVDAVAPQAGETVVVSAAAGGVGSIAVQLARRTGALVIGLASEANHAWLRAHDIVPVTYGDGQEERVKEAAHGTINAFIDTFGGGYVELALELGVAPDRIDTIIDFAAAAKHGVKTEGTSAAANAKVLAELTALIEAGRLEIPIAKVYPLADVRAAYQDLARRHTRGKIVLVP